jgi:hypothetical protein
MRSSNLHHPIGDGWLGSSGAARRWPAQCVRQLHGRLSGVEPTARSGGSLDMRSTPTLSMEDEGSHNGLRERCRGRARAADDEPDMRRYGKVGAGGGGGCLCCSSHFGYSPGGGGGGSSSSSTKRARPRRSETMTRQEIEMGA